MSECVSVENVKRITPNEGTVERADEKLRPGKSTQPYLKRQGKTERERERPEVFCGKCSNNPYFSTQGLKEYRFRGGNNRFFCRTW